MVGQEHEDAPSGAPVTDSALPKNGPKRRPDIEPGMTDTVWRAEIDPLTQAAWQRAHHQPKPVLLVDSSPKRVSRPDDLTNAILTVLLLALVLVLSIYAHGTTSGVTQDVRQVTLTALHQILLVPVTILEGLMVLLVPTAVLGANALRRDWNTVFDSVLTGAGAAVLAAGTRLLLNYLPLKFTWAFTITDPEGMVHVGIPGLLLVLAAFLTGSGQDSYQKILRWSWIIVFVVVALSVVRGTVSLPAALVALLLGRTFGLWSRWFFGVADRRASGAALIAGLYRTGLDPELVVRTNSTHTAAAKTALLVQPHSPTAPPNAAPDSLVATRATDVAGNLTPEARELLSAGSIALFGAGEEWRSTPSATDHRNYQVRTTAGDVVEVAVLDQDRQVLSALSDIWDNLRLRGLQRSANRDIRDAADRTVLLALSAETAGVRTRKVTGLGRSAESMLVVQEHLPALRTLDTLPPEELTPELLDRVWEQLGRAHLHRLSHRHLTTESIAVDPSGAAWILDWGEGELAAPELSLRVDQVQLLVLSALLTDIETALAAAQRALGEAEVLALAPVLQPVVLPSAIRRQARSQKLLTKLRDQLIAETPELETPPLQLTRFSPKALFAATVLVVALWVLLGSLNFTEVSAAVRGANPWWILVSFGAGLLTYLGAAIPLVAFSPEKIRLRDAVLTQVAASIVTLVAPAGIGPAALNLRLLNRHRISTPLALATVALVQVSQFVTTVVLLVVISLATGDAGALSWPSTTALVIAGGVVAILALIPVIPRARRFLWQRLKPTWDQIRPRLLWVMGRPGRLLAGIGGNLLLTSAFIAAFGAALAAFGYDLGITSLSVTYLASNSLGSVIPSPGGIGPVEAALTAGLQVAGIPAGVAISAAVLYRLVTFWGRVPLGWVALRILQRKNRL